MKQADYALVGDIGGTNARLALVRPGDFSLERVEVLPCGEYPGIDAAIQDYLQRVGVGQVSEACMAFACPVHADTIRLTNSPWQFSRRALQDQLGLRVFKVINDFTAMALGVLHVSPANLVKIGGDEGEPRYPRLVIGPGTGLGVSALVPSLRNWIPLATEGGHVDFAPVNDLEAAILKQLREQFGRVSVERILSGPGLVNLHAARATLEGRGRRWHQASDITSAALVDGDAEALAILSQFCEILGRVAGDAVLTVGARGGVYACGGIVPRFIDFLKTSGFRSAFEAKGRMREYMASIPIHVVTEAYTGLLGAAEALINQEV